MAITKDTGVTVKSADIINEILPFCSQGVDGRDLLAQAEYAADVQRSIGHQPGIARQGLANKQARQAAHMAAGMAQFLARRYAAGVKDDGDLDKIETALVSVIMGLLESRLPGLATLLQPGLVMPDGTTLTVDKNGVLSVIQKADAAVARLEVLRKLTIGAPKFHRSTVLPDDHAWPDGSFIEFDDWPEFYEIYKQGGFTGLVMPWNADAATQAANLGKFRPNAANPTGLYLPLHGGQFFRNWVLGAEREAGSWGRDEIRNITGSINIMRLAVGGAVGPFSLINDRNVAVGVGGVTASISDIGFSASNVVSTGPQNVPPHIWQPIILYLGRPK